MNEIVKESVRNNINICVGDVRTAYSTNAAKSKS